MAEQAQEALRLSEAATPGPWWVSHHPDNVEHFIEPEIGQADEGHEADAEFIAHARTLLPALAQQLEQAEQRADAEQAISEAREHQLAQAEQRIEELERARDTALGRANLSEQANGLLQATERLDLQRYREALERYENEAPDWLKPIARTALRQDSATGEATQETVVREDSDEG